MSVVTDCDGLITNLRNANNAAMMRPQDWAAIDGLYILDADGWRTADAPPFDQPITRAEYQRRIGECTVGPLSVAESADWCVDTGALAICGTRMREDSRRSEGDSWCFHCRKRHEFFRVVMIPDGPSYYEPYPRIVGPKSDCTDLFPGWSRTWADE